MLLTQNLTKIEGFGFFQFLERQEKLGVIKLYLDFNTNSEILQDICITSDGKEHERPWREHKMSNELLSKAYLEVDPSKSERLKNCATELSFNILSDGAKKLRTANFCRVRLCPMCGWRRGLKVFAHTKAIMDAINSEKKLSYIMLTLTCKNVTGDELGVTIDNMLSAWKRLMESKRVKQAVKGFYRGFEVLHDKEYYITEDMYEEEKKYYKRLCVHIGDLNPNYDMFHPHFHCVFAVNPSYFTDRTYISHAEWTSLWKRSLRVDYNPVLRVERVKGSTAQAVSEVAKYAVKSADYIIPDDWDLTVNTVRLLDKVLNKRRFVAYGGIFKEWHKKLNLDDEQDGDLIDFERDTEPDEITQKIWYCWNTGYNQYIKK